MKKKLWRIQCADEFFNDMQDLVMQIRRKKVWRIQYSDELFNAMQDLAIQIWNTHNDDYLLYASRQISKVKYTYNVIDNIWFIYRMFDPSDQSKLKKLAKQQYPKLYYLIRTMERFSIL